MNVGDLVNATVVRWIGDKGKPFGFARVAGEHEDLFVPSSRLLNATDLRAGEQITCEVRMDREGRLFADNVEVLDAPEAA